ncbi:tyrosine-type recombinase/integrase [Candidatus Peregrinibacteria bacterium]|nr:MAG: tyrosine-type recombinase/integrase [Candidatus Peregrinibacteria bacterium]
MSEVIALKLTVHVKQAKGQKDRISVMPESLTGDLKNNDPVFASERGGIFTKKTAQKVFENAFKDSSIKKYDSFHLLMHSFTIHLLENSNDVRYVQELLGHQNIRITQIYTQVTNPKLKNIKSPL